MINDIISLISKCNEGDIINQLSPIYGEQNVVNQLNKLTQLISQGLFLDKRKAIGNIEVKREDWFNSKVIRNLWLNISHDCNLNCIYCFGHGGNYGGRKMLITEETTKKCIDYWYKYLDKSIQKAYVVFFGGEPLMNKKVIYFAVNYINNLVKKHGIDIEYTITTNGTLLDEKFIKFIVDNNIAVTVSIDGGETIQNTNRPFVSGKGSYEIIRRKIEELKKYIKILTARITLTHENIPKLKETVQDLWDIGFSQVQYDIVSSTDENLKATEEDLKVLFDQITLLTDITYQNIIKGKWVVLRNITKVVGSIHESNVDIMGCSFYSPYTLMFTPEGNIFKCQRLIDDDNYCVGNINNGISWEKYYKSNKRPVIEKCKKCWARNICNDGCSQVNLINTGKADVAHDLWCKHIQFTIKEALRLYTTLYINNRDIFNDAFYK